MVQYKLFQYELIDQNNRVVGPDRHLGVFDGSKGADVAGSFAIYRGRRDAVLMYLRPQRSDFSGLIGRHATEREVNLYNRRDDTVIATTSVDDDYPHTPFMCFPRLGFIACVEGRPVSANSAMSRLHSILGYRRHCLFTVRALREAFDLRLAVRNLDVTEVSFEIRPVNPHTGPLGLSLDESKKLDHIQMLRGTAKAAQGDRLQLNDGLLSAVQELQQSGHATAGYKALVNNIQISVNRQDRAVDLGDDEELSEYRNTAEIKITIDRAVEYPFSQADFNEMRGIIRKFSDISDEK